MEKTSVTPQIQATIQARMGSARLPGKMLMPLAGRPLLARIIERVQQSRLIDGIIVATSQSGMDDPIEELALDMGVNCYRGSENDVLGRVVGALDAYDVDIHVELHGDNALQDPLLIDAMCGYYLKYRSECDYVTNTRKTTYPAGCEVVIYPAQVLRKAEQLNDSSIPREHVGPHIYMKPDVFRIVNIEAPVWQRYPELHFEIDTIEDYKVVSGIYEHFLPHNPFFSLSQAIEYALETGNWKLNRNIERRYAKYRLD